MIKGKPSVALVCCVAVDITSVCVLCVVGVVKSLLSFFHFLEDITLIT
jgi:hypothetical protein